MSKADVDSKRVPGHLSAAADEVTVTVTRLKGFRMQVAGSEAMLEVDIPIDEGGGGKAFRSVELLLGSLGTCMAGTIVGFAENQRISVGDLDLRLRPVLADGPHRIERIEVIMRIGGSVSQRELKSLQRVAQHCKIHSTLEQIAHVELTIDAPAAVSGDS